MYNLRSRRKSEKLEAALRELAPKSRRRSNNNFASPPHDLEYDNDDSNLQSLISTRCFNQSQQKRSLRSSHLTRYCSAHKERTNLQLEYETDDIGILQTVITEEFFPGTPRSIVSIAGSIIDTFREATGMTDDARGECTDMNEMSAEVVISPDNSLLENIGNEFSTRDGSAKLIPDICAPSGMNSDGTDASSSDFTNVDVSNANDYVMTHQNGEDIIMDTNGAVITEVEENGRTCNILSAFQSVCVWYDSYHYGFNKVLFTFQEVNIFLHNVQYIKQSPATILLSLFFVPSRESSRNDIRKIFHESANLSKTYLILSCFVCHMSIYLAWRYLYRVIDDDGKVEVLDESIKLYSLFNQLSFGLISVRDDGKTISNNPMESIQPLDSADVVWNIYVVDNMVMSCVLLLLYILCLYDKWCSPLSNIVVVLQKTILLIGYVYRLCLPFPQWLHFLNSWNDGARYIPLLVLFKIFEMFWLLPATIKIIGSTWKQKRVCVSFASADDYFVTKFSCLRFGVIRLLLLITMLLLVTLESSMRNMNVQFVSKLSKIHCVWNVTTYFVRDA